MAQHQHVLSNRNTTYIFK